MNRGNRWGTWGQWEQYEQREQVGNMGYEGTDGTRDAPGIVGIDEILGTGKECRMISIRKKEGTVKNKEQKNEISIRNLGTEGTMETEGTVENI